MISTRFYFQAVFFIVLFLCACHHPQELKGKYNERICMGRCVRITAKFSRDHTFTWKQKFSTGPASKSQGSWLLKKDTLILDYKSITDLGTHNTFSCPSDSGAECAAADTFYVNKKIIYEQWHDIELGVPYLK